MNIDSNGWIDISVPIFSGVVHWPGETDCELTRTSSIGDGAVCNVSKLKLSVHTGTHMDAPLHFIDHGKSIDTMPFTATIGRARVIEIEDKQSIKPAELERHHINTGERLLFKTVNSTRCWNTSSFVEDFVYISQDAARYLVQKQVRSIGIDYLSVGGYPTDSVETHQALLGAGIWVIEGLNLAEVAAGEYELICLPLKLLGADGSPARAILKR